MSILSTIVPDQKYFITTNDDKIAEQYSLKKDFGYTAYFDKVIDNHGYVILNIIKQTPIKKEDIDKLNIEPYDMDGGKRKTKNKGKLKRVKKTRRYRRF